MILILLVKYRIPNKIQTTKKGRKQAARAIVTKRVPAAVATTIRTRQANLNGKPIMRIRHSETVGGISGGNGTFTVYPLCLRTPGMDLNPCCPDLFPWLSSVAPSFEEYTFHSLSFELISSNPTSFAGRVYMALDYDYDDDPNVTMTQLMANSSSASGPVYQNLSLKADPKKMHGNMPRKFTSVQQRPTYVEPRTSFCGFLLIATDAVQVSTFDLRISYDVELFTPQLEATLVRDAFTAYAPVATSALTTAVGGVFAGPVPALTGATGITSPVAMVVPGSGNVPLMNVPAGSASVAATSALDLLSARTGNLELDVKNFVTGVSPSSLGATSGLVTNSYVFDSLGNSLGALADVPGVRTTFGVETPSSMNTASAHYLAKTLVPLANLFNTYKLAKYIAPSVLSLAGLNAGGIGAGFKFSV